MFRPMMGSAFGAPGFPHDMMRDPPPGARRRQTASNSGGLTTKKVQEMIDESLGKVTAEAVATPEPIVAGGYTASQIKAMTDYAVHTHFRKAMAEAIAGKPEKDADQKAVEDGLAKAVQQIKAGWGMPAAGAAPQQPHSDDDVMAKAVASLKASMGRR